MNCKPGDLAVIIPPFEQTGVDHIVVVVRRAKRIERFGSDLFLHEGRMLGWVCSGNVPASDGHVLQKLVIADECLRPIRDPGEDATDETLQWLPVPSREKDAV